MPAFHREQGREGERGNKKGGGGVSERAKKRDPFVIGDIGVSEKEGTIAHEEGGGG